MIRSVSWLSDFNYVCSTWNFAGHLFILTENSHKYTQKTVIFLLSLKLFSNSIITMESTAAFFLLFTGLHWADIPKYVKLHAIIWFSTALFPLLVLDSVQIGLIVYQHLVVAEQWVYTGCHHDDMMQGAGHTENHAGLHAVHGLWVWHVCSKPFLQGNLFWTHLFLLPLFRLNNITYKEENLVIFHLQGQIPPGRCS